MIATEPDLTYSDLDIALQHLGYIREDYEDARIYRYPPNPDAILTFPPLPWEDNVRVYHHFAARQIVDSFGVADADDFELLLLRITHKQLVNSGVKSPAARRLK